MKKFIAVLIALAVIICFIIIHSVIIVNLSKDIENLSNSAYTSAVDNNWETAIKNIEEIESKWNRRRVWAHLTIDAHNIEEIENALDQSKKFAQQKELPDFTDKITLFINLIKQIPNQEGLNVKNLL